MEKRNFVIAINREFGSGGREIACKLGNLLGINVYDKDILDRLTKQFNLTVEEIESIMKVMDMTAFTMCKENDMPMYVFDMNTRGNLLKVLRGENIGTLVTK